MVSKKLVIFATIGLVILIIFLGGKFFGKKSYSPELYQAPSESVEKVSKESFSRKIKGIGFKEGAWAKYKLENWGVRFSPAGKEPLIQEMKVATLSFKVGNEELLGIEIGLDFGTFSLLFEKEGDQLKHVIFKPKDKDSMCWSNFPLEFAEGIYQEYKKQNLKDEYEVDETLSFKGKEKIKLESGKEIEVLKFERKAPMEVGDFKIEGQEFWFSGQVPTYFVYFAEKYSEGGKEKLGPSMILIDYDEKGASSVMTEKDLKKCESKKESLPGIPSEASKFFCQSDQDCACGVDRETGKCAFGNKNFIDTSKQCADFCTGFGGQFEIKCIGNICQPKLR